MLLQTIHQIKDSARASSIYCRWIRSGNREGSPLVAVWIDSEMRGFEREFAPDSNRELLPEDALDEPGGAHSFRPHGHAIATETASQLS
jgi:hypothetical protein